MTNYQVESREWWVERWLELLDSYRFKKRLERARNYAREGHVLNIDFKDSQAFAQVQGSEIDPYEVSIRLEKFSDEDWDYVIETLSEKAIFSAQLLAGTMPDNIEKVFEQSGLSLFPFRLGEVRSRCSCPDKANPCKHIAAVYYQLADYFSEDPFIIFQLRGQTKVQILEKLGEKRRKIAMENPRSLTDFCFSVESNEDLSSPPSSPSPEADYLEFWRYTHPLDADLVVITPPAQQKSLLDILGQIPLPYEDANLVTQFLQQVYQIAQQKAMFTALNSEEEA